MDPRLACADGTALGCSVRLVVTRPRTIRVAEVAVAGVLRAVDESCSRFRADSEVRLLEESEGRDVALSPMLTAALAAALRAARTSNGAVDPTVGRAVAAAGYDRDFALVPPDGGAIHVAGAAVPGWRSIRLDTARRTASVPPGVSLDLGATAKALAADLAAEAALEATGGGVLVSLGGDVAMRGEAPAGGWQVQVGEDSRDAVSPRAEAVRVVRGGIATSSTTVRRWRRGGATLHHLIDPRTGLPAAGPWRTATVAAGTCVDANTATTAAIVLGAAAVGWIAAAGLPARLVDSAGAVTRTGGWPEPAATAEPAA
jgi:thiamine biosynthesis lipoprotein ApbE